MYNILTRGYGGGLTRTYINGLGSQADTDRRAKIDAFAQIWPDLQSQLQQMQLSDAYVWAEKNYLSASINGQQKKPTDVINYWIGEINRAANEALNDASPSATVGSLAVDYITFKSITPSTSRYDAGQINAGGHPLGKSIPEYIFGIFNDIIYPKYLEQNPNVAKKLLNNNGNKKKTNWWLIGGISAGVLALVGTGIFIKRRK